MLGLRALDSYCTPFCVVLLKFNFSNFILLRKTIFLKYFFQYCMKFLFNLFSIYRVEITIDWYYLYIYSYSNWFDAGN